MEVLYVSPADQGHSGVARDRLYAILWLRAKLIKTADPRKLYQDTSDYNILHILPRLEWLPGISVFFSFKQHFNLFWQYGFIDPG